MEGFGLGFRKLTKQVEPTKPRKAIFSKGAVLYMAPDFDAPLDEIKDYM